MSRPSRLYFFYFAFLLVLAPVNLLSFDSYYYWDWSRHLAWSYYDGSPMIAWLIKLSTLSFGDSLFALSLVGIVTTALTSFIIYKTARLFLTTTNSYLVLGMWLFSPLVTLDLLKQTTYDNPLTLFWALSLYFVLKFIKFQHITDLYCLGIAAGFMLLSKYTGVVLLLAFFIFLLSTRYRYLFKSAHFYLTLLIIALIFSPVIVWNSQNHWQSFLYQLTTHQLQETGNPFANSAHSFFYLFLPALNGMLVPPLLYRWNKKRHLSLIAKHQAGPQAERHRLMLNLCRIVCATFLCFYLFAASKATIREYWLTPFIITSALIGGFNVQTFHYRKITFLMLAIYATASIGILLNTTLLFNVTTPEKRIYYQLIQQFNTDYTPIPDTVFTAGWMEARMLFFLKNKPAIRTLDCGSAPNQYEAWSRQVIEDIRQKKVKNALYIDRYDRSSCLANYFDECQRVPSASITHGQHAYSLYVYQCHNH